MEHGSAPTSVSFFASLPSVDELLRSRAGKIIVRDAGVDHAALLARKVIDQMRQKIRDKTIEKSSKSELGADAVSRLENAWQSELKTSIQRTINATGVIIHTNLGRAPLSDAAKQAVFEQASGYCTLEYDLEAGKRGRRGGRAEDLIVELTGAEDALIVNNGAAAAFFVLTVFASGGEVVISRGELVEIGGDFRVPDVLKQSGAHLQEVGTTNRTKLADYENAITSDTRVILRVHPSNYRIVGFTATPVLADLVDLAHRRGLLLYEDIGSGALGDLTGFGLIDEPIVGESIAAGADVVTFSGDKLLGGPQAGIIAGKVEFIDRLRKHALCRALRVDKLVIAALEATLDAHRRKTAANEIPVLKMLSATPDELAGRARRFIEQLGSDDSVLEFEVINGNSAVGGGSAPAVHPETALLALQHKKMSARGLETNLRNSSPPVIARIVDDRVVIDLRTVSPSEENELLEILRKF